MQLKDEIPLLKAKVTETTAAVVPLRILATTDLHMHLSGNDYFFDAPGRVEGLAFLSRLVERERSTCTNTLLLDDGDFLNGSPMGEAIASACHSGDWRFPHPMIAAMNALGYDAVTLGNHEFSHGVPFLTKALGDATFAIVSANCDFQDPHSAPVTRGVILTRQVKDEGGKTHSLRIGITGGVPPQTATWDQQAIAGQVLIGSLARSVEGEAKALRDRGADIVIVLAHCGAGGPEAEDGAEQAALRIARSPDVDAVVLGHIHLAFPGPETAEVENWVEPTLGRLAGKPAVMAGVHGSHLGVIDLRLSQDDLGKWQVVESTSRVESVGSAVALPQTALTRSIDEISTAAHSLTQRWATEVIGETNWPLHSYFAMICDCPKVELVNRAQSWFVAERLEKTDHGHLPILSAASAFRFGGRGGVNNFVHIAAGAIRRSDVAGLYTHPNTITAIRLTGFEIRHWLETSASVFNSVAVGCRDQDLIDAKMPSYNFDVILGLQYEIDLSRPAHSGRIRNLMRDGVAVQDGDTFILATNSYRISGSGGFVQGRPDIVLADRKTNRDVVAEYIKAHSPLTWDMPRRQNWRFSPLAETRAVFATSPKAADYLAQLTKLDPKVIGNTDSGFMKVSIAI